MRNTYCDICYRKIGLLETRYSNKLGLLDKFTPGKGGPTIILLREQKIIIDICKDCFKTLGKTGRT